MASAVRACCIPGCKSLGFKDGEKLCSFPLSVERRQSWMDSIRQNAAVSDLWTPHPNSYVCQIHFEKTCFIQESENAPQKMARGAIPTIFPPNPLTLNKAAGKPTVSIIRTRRAAGIVPKPKMVFEVDSSPSTRFKRDVPLPGHTFKPIIAKASGDTQVSPTLTSKGASVVVISTEPLKAGAKRGLSSANMSNAKKSNLSSCGNCVQMQEKLNQKASTIRELEIKIADLKQELNQQDSTRTAAVSKIDRLKESLKDIYTEHQLVRLCDGTTRGRPWDLETVRRAAKLVLACGRNGYQEILNQGQPFPSLKTLNRLLYKRRYLVSTLDNPDPVIANELRDEMSDSDHEDESEGSAEEIEENIINGEEGRILKKSKKTRKSRNSLQKCNEAFQDIQASQAVHALDAEAAILEGVEAMADNQLLLQQIDLGDEVEPHDSASVTAAIISQYGGITIVQDSSATAPQLTPDIIDDILRTQNIPHEEVREIRVEGAYITILKHADLLEEGNLLSQGIIS